jgi:hypothetical protein
MIPAIPAPSSSHRAIVPPQPSTFAQKNSQWEFTPTKAEMMPLLLLPHLPTSQPVALDDQNPASKPATNISGSSGSSSSSSSRTGRMGQFQDLTQRQEEQQQKSNKQTSFSNRSINMVDDTSSSRQQSQQLISCKGRVPATAATAAAASSPTRRITCSRLISSSSPRFANTEGGQD